MKRSCRPTPERLIELCGDRPSAAGSLALRSEPLPKRFRRGTHRIADPGETLARVRPHDGPHGDHPARQHYRPRPHRHPGRNRGAAEFALGFGVARQGPRSAAGDGLGVDGSLRRLSRRRDRALSATPPIAISRRSETVVDPDTLCAGTAALRCQRRRSRGSRATICFSASLAGSRPKSCIPTTRGEPGRIFSRRIERPRFRQSPGRGDQRGALRARRARCRRAVGRPADPNARRAARSTSPPSTTRIAARFSRKYEAAGIAVRVWHVTTDIGIAAFLCEIRDPSRRRPAAAAPLSWLRLPRRSSGLR